MVYSYSSLSTYMQCPYAFKKYYIDKVKTLGGAAANVGTYVHESIRATLQGEEQPFINLSLGALNEAEDFIKDSDMILSVIDNEYNPVEIISEQDIFVDRNFKVVEPNDENSMLRGIVDLIIEDLNGDLIVFDWKTGKSEPDTLQLFIYAILVDAKYGTLPKEVGFIKIRNKSFTTIPVEPETIEAVKKYILKLVDVIENDTEFTPKIGTHCSYCSVIHACPLAQDLNIPDLTTKENIILALQKAHVLKNLANDIEKRVKETLDKNDVVENDKYKVFYDKTEFYSFVGRKQASSVINEIINRISSNELGKYLKINTNELVEDERFKDIVERFFTKKERHSLKLEEK